MKKGINYDTGFLPGQALSRKAWDPAMVAREMRVIARELHCDAVRIGGREPARIALAAEHAAAEGLEVWFSPIPVDLDADRTLEVLADAAGRAETLRKGGAEVVLVTGCELTAFGPGYIDGATYLDRLTRMGAAGLDWWMGLMQVMPRFNAYLARVAATVRPLFGGPLSYAAGAWELVDWTPFDLVGVNHYRAAHNAHDYAEELRARFAAGKPVVVTEFGTCPYQGAGERGGMAWTVPEGARRDEGEQVRYYTELMDVFEREGVAGAFWFMYAAYNRPGEADLGSYGVVRMLDDTRWEPKEVFAAMAARNRARTARDARS
ncbi:hypothetical protein MF672_043425 [Actinomadura sp. ATCC 31491]|uniref:Asl1-like glycosyl hydrolase catalytic domain-containing protein n=1 Tax=Actinomadura luzonensis TaxID=2805427 RepID=A0ABT0G871_9ACTN|nr:hypothetical protein [Actinomadura luzonensis]MCK2220608.1 hypothetical protein [Actinomadura luzonensis]